MKQVLIIIAIIFCVVAGTGNPGLYGAPAEQIPVSGGKILFASVPVTHGAYAKVATRSMFSSSEKIYARIFLDQPVGEIRNNEAGFVDLWIDGRFVRRMTFTNRDLSRSQSEFQLFILNTGQDDFAGSPLSTLDQGEHDIRLQIGRIYNREQPITRYGGGGAATMWTVYLAEGRFIIKVR